MHWFSISGTASRRQALLACGAAVFLTLLVMLLARSTAWWPAARWVAPLAGIAWAALTATLIRRLHDIGRSGAWVLLILAGLPLIGGALMALLIGMRPARRSWQPSLPGAVLGGTLVGLILALGLASALWRPVAVTSGAMKPTLLIGDMLLVRHGVPDLPARGSLLMVRDPVTGRDTPARLIGLPGDRIALQDGEVILNGTPLPRRPAGRFSEIYQPQGPDHSLPRCEIQVGLGGTCTAPRLTETLPDGYSYAVLDHETRSGAPDNLPDVTVPEGHFYLLGDSRDTALDSRFAPATGGFGMVPSQQISGQVDLILFSSAQSRPKYLWSWRANRLLARVDRIEAE